jgi:hypothetical protein
MLNIELFAKIYCIQVRIVYGECPLLRRTMLYAPNVLVCVAIIALLDESQVRFNLVRYAFHVLSCEKIREIGSLSLDATSLTLLNPF